jgi:His-Xaa-Ser system protein HxsD
VQDSSTLRIDHRLVSVEALLKTCYWFSRDFLCDVQDDGAGFSVVYLTPKSSMDEPMPHTRERFLTDAMDFSLREIIAKKTENVRELLLAKAFSESGIFEEEPRGIFGDQIEESKPDGMFKILGNS